MKLRFLRTTVLTALASAALAMPFLPTQAAGDTVDIKLAEGTYHFDYAQEVLRETNRYRKAAGLNPVVLDKQLTDAAMQRAAECAIDYSHTRPNGGSHYSIIDGYIRYMGENIHCTADPHDAVEGWYLSPGHRDTMMYPEATAMGVGSFTIDGSGGYSVQIFGGDPIITKDTRNNKVNVQPIVEIKKSSLKLSQDEPGEIIERIDAKNNKIPLMIQQENYGMGLDTYIDGSNFSWTVADPSVAKVDANGVVTELSEDRTTKVTAKLKADPSKSVTVDLGKIRDFNDSTTIEFAEFEGRTRVFPYTGKPIKPEIKVIFNDGEYIDMETGATWENKWDLKEGVDYTVSYKNNVKVGTATLTIHGKGKYFGSTSETFEIQDWGDYNPTGLKENAEIEFVIPIDYDGYRYTGEPLEPPVKVKFYDGEKYSTLKEGTDYTVSYKDNVGNSMGWGFGKVIVKGKGKYNGTISKEFYISTDGTPLKPSKPSEPNKPSKPTEIKVGKPKVKAKSYYNKIVLTWSSAKNAEGYLVYRKTGNSAYKLVKKLSRSAKSYTDAGASYGKKYSYKVKAYHKSKLKPSKKVYGTGNTVYGRKMLSKTKLKLTTSKGKQTLKWNKVKGANGYYLYQKKGDGTYKRIKTLPSKTISYTVKTKKGSTYSYKVVGYRVIKGKKYLGTYSPVVKGKAN